MNESINVQHEFESSAGISGIAIADLTVDIHHCHELMIKLMLAVYFTKWWPVANSLAWKLEKIQNDYFDVTLFNHFVYHILEMRPKLLQA